MPKRKQNSQPIHESEVRLEDRDSNDGAPSRRCSVVREEPFQSRSEVRSAPLEGAIRAGKNTYVYDAHTYHTKVPPSGIAQLIEYYTKPGDIVLDPFCGSGMTGIAAAELGREALLSDLSPAAVFIARHLNSPIDAKKYMKAIRVVISEAQDLDARLYNTQCRSCGSMVPMLYMVWSYGVICPSCAREFLLWDVARDERARVRDSKILSTFDCPHCHRRLVKRGLKRTRRYPVQVGYKCCGRGPKEQTAELTEYDRAKLNRIEQEGVPQELWYPRAAFPNGINTRQPIAAGITRVDQAYTTRALHAMAWLWKNVKECRDPEIAGKLLFTLTSLYQRITVFSEFRFWGGSSNTANYNVPFISNEQNVFRTFLRKANTISWYFESAAQKRADVDVCIASACDLKHVADKSVDYIFTDPPFGGNINYSEMNFLWESWLDQYTDTREEAIVNSVQGKDEEDYRRLLTRAFKECRRVLKDRGWLTIVFHNSSRSVWGALEQAIRDAGFAVNGSQTFDKTHGTFKQFVSDNAVGYDLVLHCRTTNGDAKSLRPMANVHSTIREFVAARITANPAKYRVRYLHVARMDEWDLRKLYSEWLAESKIAKGALIGFEEFRECVGPVLPKAKILRSQPLLFNMN
jgi:DNA modification methylase